MQARVWGCRGSLATPGAGRYGGNTPCVEVRADGGLIVLDAGTGIRALGETLAGIDRLDLLLTHLHLDHIEGLGFFAPLHDPACAVTIWGPPGTAAGIETWLSPPFYPLPFAQFEAAIEVREVQNESFEVAGLAVRCAVVPHPGRTLGYRVDGLAYIPDHEAGADRAAAELAGGADVLLHDAQYSEDEYRERIGWGHSSVWGFAAVVGEAEPARALTFHHDPGHDDAALEALRDEASRLAGREIEITAEGLVI